MNLADPISRKNFPRALRSVALWALAFSALLTAVGAASSSRAETSARTETELGRDRSFEHQVRKLFFQVFEDDRESFDRAMEMCDQALAENPEDAEALVWRGAGRLMRSNWAYQGGQIVTGAKLWNQGLEEMARAIELEDAVYTRVPRAASLLGASRNLPWPVEAKRLLAIAMDDYERALEMQAPYFDQMNDHSRGELLIALAEGHHRLGNEEEARAYVDRIEDELGGSEYARAVVEAAASFEGLDRLSKRACIGCHTKE